MPSPLAGSPATVRYRGFAPANHIAGSVQIRTDGTRVGDDSAFLRRAELVGELIGLTDEDLDKKPQPEHVATNERSIRGVVSTSCMCRTGWCRMWRTDLRVTGLEHEGDPVLIYKK